MAFQTALSGLNGAQANLSVTGNNIANASTTGFKKSRAEFVDIYASSFGGVSGNAIGAGVRLSAVAQQFTQGNIEFTERNLDLAINGNGFFQLGSPAGTVYSRNGSFHTDANGLVVNAQGQILQAYQADAAGNITGAMGDLQISTADLAPQATTNVEVGVNLNSQAVLPNGAGATSAITVAGDLDDAASPVSSGVISLVGNDGIAIAGAQLDFTSTGNPGEWTVTLSGIAPGTSTTATFVAGVDQTATLTWDPDDTGWQSPIDITVDLSGMTDVTVAGTGSTITSVSADGVELPAFDPNDPNTYNNSTSLTVYDSLGGSHLLSTYYVKLPEGNSWEVYTYVDGVDISNGTGLGRGDSNLVTFSTVGALATIDGAAVPPSTLTTDTFTPTSGGGGAALPANMQLTLDLGDATQYGSPFAVNSLSQDGYSVGRLSTLSIDDDGIVFARYSNGRALAQGQVVLVNFANPNGLSPLGDSTWGETSESGAALVGAPNTSSLGSIQSGALEASNVDLSRELVNMILAQRDFQANAKMISTEDAVTQTIINIR